MERRTELDVLRGAFLLVMTMTHLPTRWSEVFQQPVGFVSAAEGFVLLSAFLAGRVYLHQRQRLGPRPALRALLKRTFRLYLYHLALLAFAFSAIAWVAVAFDRPAVKGLLIFYLESPLTAILTGVALLYRPALLDILPMYVNFLLLTPLAYYLARRWSWGAVLSLSGALWLVAQFGVRRALETALLPALGLEELFTGAFDLLGWQFLWICGLALAARPIDRPPLSDRVFALTVALAVAFGAWRYLGGPHGGLETVGAMFLVDKWSLGPIRLLNVAVLTMLLMGLNSRIQAWSAGPLARLGQSSLWVFCGHALIVLLMLCLVDEDGPLEGPLGLAMLAVGYVSLFVFAALNRWKDRLQAPKPLATAEAGSGSSPGAPER